MKLSPLEKEILRAYVLNCDRSYLYAHPEVVLNKMQEGVLAKLVARRLKGEPMAYLTGEREFWSLGLKVTPAVLIPRPETEILVETALNLLSQNESPDILELGTGSGAISIALATERPLWSIIATDISTAALDIARENAQRHHVLAQINFVHSDWYDTLLPSVKFAAIVSNPPYIASGDPHLWRDGLSYEPGQALVAGADGLLALRQIIKGAPDFLIPGGWLILEHGFDQADAVVVLLRQSGFEKVHTVRDLQGLPRVTYGSCAQIF